MKDRPSDRPSDGPGERPEPFSRVDELLFECLETAGEGGDVEEIVERLARENPEHAATLRRRFEALRDVGLVGDVAPDAALPGRLGDFELERRIGSGGMGVVYLAEQLSMGRRVALKLVRPDQLHLEDVRARFGREIGAVARLSHPGIVQVFTVGAERDVPYLAMEYVAGASLDRLIARLAGGSARSLTGEDLRRVLADELESHGEDGPFEWDDDLFRGSWRDVCVRIVRRVAEALEHAHGRGVLHRDVKPSNVMITPSGRVLLLDFGLARLAGADALTRSGSELGSLPYMPPERLDQRPVPDRRGDVYSLGVTFYELLTLRSPFLDESSGETTRRRILEGRALLPERIDPTLSGDVQTVCMVAMDRDPERRYASAGALAGDLTNVLELRPISARPASIVVHVRRWAERRPALATAIAMGLAITVLAPTGFLVQEVSANRRIRAEIGRTDVALERSLAALRLLVDTADDDLQDIPQASEARRNLLDGAREFYETLVPERPEDASVRLRFAKTRLRSARIAKILGDVSGAEQHYRDGLSELTALEGRIDESHRRRELAIARAGLAGVLLESGDPREAETLFEQVGSALTGLDSGELGTEARFELAYLRGHLGNSYRDRGQHDDAMREYEAAVGDLQALLEESKQAKIFEYCGAILNQQAVLQMIRGAEERATECLVQAVEVLERGLVERPRNRRMREQLLQCVQNLARQQIGAGDAEKATMTLERACTLADELLADYPEVTELRGQVALTRINRAVLLSHGGDPELALAALDEADGHLQHVATVTGNLHWDAHYTLSLQLRMRIQQDDPERVLELAAEFEPRAQRVIRAQPGYPLFQPRRILVAGYRVRAHLQLGQLDSAAAALRSFELPSDPELLVSWARTASASIDFAQSLDALPEARRFDWTVIAFESTFASLSRAVEQGGVDPLALEHEDFDPVRADPAFLEIVDAVAESERAGD